MADFKKTLMTVAITLLIVVLIILGIMMSRAASEASWPPQVGECPDYWQESGINGPDGETELIQCNNVQNLGNPNCKRTMNFNGNMWKGDDGDCRKKTWAKGCDLTWDGITNNSKVCNTTSED